MKEDLLHYVWRLQRFDNNDLETTDGQPVQIQNRGEHNSNAGPDFTLSLIHI